MRRSLIACAFAVAVLAAPVAHAVQPDEIMADPVKEARARDLSRELRCMVCQNQSIDDSDAPLARDLRLLVRERIAAGDSDGQVPPLALLGGGFALWRYSRRRQEPSGASGDSAAKLTAEEQARLEQLMAAEPAADRPN